MLVDPKKLADLRDVVDLSIVEIAVQSGVSRRDALKTIAQQLDYAIGYYKVGDWYVACAQSYQSKDEISLYQQHQDWDRAADVDVETSFERIAIAGSPEDSAIALILGILDKDCDVFFDADELVKYYPGSCADFISEIASSIEWYIRTQVWFQDMPQFVNLAQLGSIVEMGGNLQAN